ncbi:M14 family zinc carboxypeptidase [Sinimarinibacterium thermocellulolyticum]|uniref:M14 family zinc carboxypeptidase n=1 Tax=Sinimarinibacterium thermocellulolyticum TaxID=3170016 RepID=A0ABV2A587_9GAMM
MAQLLARPFSTGDFPELDAIHALIRRADGSLRSEVLHEVVLGDERLPVYCLELGNADPRVPAVGFFGGIHGVERIGAQVLIAFLQTLIERLYWDESLSQALERVRLVFMPLVNPGGMRRRTRSNPAGVDLMRNAPVDADHDVSWLLGGQRLTPALPWYRGRADAPMEPEAQALCRVVEERLLPHAFSLSIDCHSGFGTKDRIWFPYARTRQPIDCLPEIYALRTMFRTTHPYHSIYVIEPQARQYTTHGDLWDYLYDRAKAASARPFIPFTLEMGSWLWVKKRPAQLFSVLGIFNPIAPHRHQRILRTHLTLFDFMIRAAISHERWRPSPEVRSALHEAAMAYWYGPQPLNRDLQPART